MGNLCPSRKSDEINLEVLEEPIEIKAPVHEREFQSTTEAKVEEQITEKGISKKVNQYVIQEQLGRGAYGAVHRAVDDKGEEYAVKIISKSYLKKKRIGLLSFLD